MVFMKLYSELWSNHSGGDVDDAMAAVPFSRLKLAFEPRFGEERNFIAEEGGSFITMADRFTEYEDGGYLGFVPLLAMPPEWVSVVATLEEGEISQPIKVKDTYELVMRGRFEEPGVMKLSKVRELAYEKTREKMTAQARTEVLNRILIDMEVQMDTRPLSDMLIRLVDRAEQLPRYWLDPYR